MTIITDTATLARHAEAWGHGEYIAVDTEFMRESTYWPKLCLVQVGGEGGAAAIDPLAPGLDLGPLLALIEDPRLIKVFHAARQDVEIFFQLMGKAPEPLFDTQIAAMVCGFGDQVGYERLVSELTGASLDKASRFTDWSRRPLTRRQIDYALADVIHLMPIYEALSARLEAEGRGAWVAEEMAALADPAAYRMDPDEAWRRLKLRQAKPRMLAVLKPLAAWREREAQRRDVPRGRILRDEALLEIASHAPRDSEALAATRGLSRSVAEGRQGEAILAAVAEGLATPRDEWPKLPRREAPPDGIGPTVELLRVLLKLKAERHEVAQRLIASADDLERIAAGARDVPALQGWRRDVFGADAEALTQGRIALKAGEGAVEVVPL